MINQHLTHGDLLAAAAHTPLDPAAQAHLDTCSACQVEVSALQGADALFAPLRHSLPHSGAHPTPEALANFAAGIDAPEILPHLVTCARCVEIVAAARQDELEPLAPASPEWLTRTADTCRHAAEPIPFPLRYWLPLAAALLLSLATFGVWRALHPAPAALLAKAYTEARPFEFRLPNSGYAELHLEKGATSRATDSLALLEARPAIRQQLQRHPDDPALKALNGRSLLLERNYEAAIQDLTAARQALPEDLDILADLAVAFAARGQQEHRNSDLTQAMEYLLQLVRKAPPADPKTERALFNLGLIQQDLSQMDQAAETWRKVLALKLDEGWRREAQRHLDEILQLLDRKKKADAEMYQSPAQFLAAHVPNQDFDPLPYFETFWINWMPTVRTEALSHETGPATTAANMVAHGFANLGEWSLLETVQAAARDKDGGLLLLAQAARANRALGTPADQPSVAAPAAIVILTRENLPAAANVARLEVAFTSRRASQLPQCLSVLDAPLHLSPSRYKWLLGVAHLEHVSCNYRVGQEGAARAETETAFRDLTRDRIWPLAMRASVYLASLDARIGNYLPVWDSVPDSMREYWVKPASFNRLQGFMDYLSSASVAAGWIETALLTARGAAAAHRQGDAGMEASNRATAAELLLQSGRYPEALTEWTQVDRLLATLGPHNPVAPALAWSVQVGRVQVESVMPARSGLVARIETLLAASHGHDTADLRRLHQALGLALLADGNWQQAANALRQPIEINQKSAAALTSWVERVALIESAAPSYSTLADIELRHAKNPAAALQIWELYRPRQLSTRDAHWLTLAALPSGLVAFSQSPSGVTGRHLATPVSDLRQLAGQYAQACATRTSSAAALDTLGTRLYEALIAPELAKFADGTVRISAEPWLAAVPFEALSTKFGARFSFAQDYGPAPRPAALLWKSQPLIVAAPSGRIPGHITPLPLLHDAEQEAATLATRLGTTPLRDPATLSARIATATLFHFTGHGWANGGNGALLLPPTGDGQPAWLGARDIAKQDWSRCELAVLSACLTAAGEQQGVVNSQSLVQAFLSAGARQVLAARWSVDSESTKALMDVFYAHLLAVETAAQSLAAAEQRISRDPRWPHPYFWAGFTLFGLPLQQKEEKTL